MPAQQPPENKTNKNGPSPDQNTTTQPVVAGEATTKTIRTASKRVSTAVKKSRKPTPKRNGKVVTRTQKPVDLFDTIDCAIQNSGKQLRANLVNLGVAAGIVLLIIAAHWATQQEIATEPVARSLAVAPTTEAVAPSTPEKTAAPTLEAQATVDEKTPSSTVTPEPAQPVKEAPTNVVTPEPVATPPTPTPEPAVAAPTEPTPTPSPAIPAGTVIETSVSIRATLDPTKTPPAMEQPAAPQPTRRLVHRVRSTTPARPRTNTMAQTAWQTSPYGEPDPYTNGGPQDLDGPQARQQYLQQSGKLSATRRK